MSSGLTSSGFGVSEGLVSSGLVASEGLVSVLGIAGTTGLFSVVDGTGTTGVSPVLPVSTVSVAGTTAGAGFVVVSTAFGFTASSALTY